MYEEQLRIAGNAFVSHQKHTNTSADLSTTRHIIYFLGIVFFFFHFPTVTTDPPSYLHESVISLYLGRSKQCPTPDCISLSFLLKFTENWLWTGKKKLSYSASDWYGEFGCRRWRLLELLLISTLRKKIYTTSVRVSLFSYRCKNLVVWVSTIFLLQYLICKKSYSAISVTHWRQYTLFSSFSMQRIYIVLVFSHFLIGSPRSRSSSCLCVYFSTS